MAEKNHIVIGVVVAVVVLGIVAIIIGVSFQDVQYYEMGFKRRKTTGTVDTSKVYTTGRYLVGPDYTFKTFPADAHTISLNSVSVFAKDKLEIQLTVTFQYFLSPDTLKYLHDQYDIYYENIMISSARDALKNAAVNFATNFFINNRTLVESELFKSVRERLGGSCCPKNCQTKSMGCPAGCKPYSSCQTSDKGLFADVRYFQMHHIGIPSGVADRKLRALIQEEEASTEIFKQSATVVRKVTQQKVQQIQNDIAELSQNATAQATLIDALAKANSTATIEGASADGLKALYTTLGLTNNSHRATFDYLRTLKDMNNARYAVDFNQMVMLLGGDAFSP